MKRNLFAIVAAGAIALGGFAVAQPEDGPGGKGGWHGHGNPLEHMTETLKLTPDQQTKVQPILDQAKPQIIAIHKDAMQKGSDGQDDVANPAPAHPGTAAETR